MALTLIVEDGTAKPDANSYASVEQCDAHHEAHLYADAWTTASPQRKAAALAMATRTINNAMDWNGYRRSSEQALDWPRMLVERSEIATHEYLASATYGAYWPEDKIPQPLVEATCEMARELLATNRSQDDPSKGIQSLGLGQGALSVTFTAADRKYVLTDEVLRLLSAFGRPKGRAGTIRITRVQ